MRPPLVVIIDPVRDPGSGVLETDEQAFVEKLVAHAAVEALTEAVLHGLSGRNEMPVDLAVPLPCEHRV